MSWIEDKTNRTDEYWVARVQHLIAKNTVARDDGHGDTDEKWVHQLVDEIVKDLPVDETYDGNMRIAAILGYVLTLWFTATQIAKTFDSHRPTNIRQKAYIRLNEYKREFCNMMWDMSKHPGYYPNQPWQFPFDPEAKGGDFV